MKFRWYDLVIIIGVIIGTLILSAFIYINPTKGEMKYMVVKKENEEIYRLNLGTILDEVSITIDGKVTKMTLVCDKDGCYVLHSGCPDQVCVERGKIIDSGDLPIICMPNEISISIIYE